jgi:hypothetical protein
MLKSIIIFYKLNFSDNLDVTTNDHGSPKWKSPLTIYFTARYINCKGAKKHSIINIIIISNLKNTFFIIYEILIS